MMNRVMNCVMKVHHVSHHATSSHRFANKNNPRKSVKQRIIPPKHAFRAEPPETEPKRDLACHNGMFPFFMKISSFVGAKVLKNDSVEISEQNF